MLGSLVEGYTSKRGAEKSSRAMAGASRYAADLQQKRYEQTREDFAPYRQVGTQALRSLADLSGLNGSADFSSFERSPGHQFRLQQGEQALNRAAAARGRLDSGATMQDLMRFGQGLASNEFNNYNNRLAALAGVGQNATTTLGSLGATSAANQGNALMQAGQARASGYEGVANAYGNAIGNIYGMAGLFAGGGFGG